MAGRSLCNTGFTGAKKTYGIVFLCMNEVKLFSMSVELSLIFMAVERAYCKNCSARWYN